jgi:signal transduction histidine kinase
MTPGSARQGQSARLHLVPQSDGYADYIDLPQGQEPGQDGTAHGQRTSRTGYAGRRRKGRAGHATRQRSIRSTIMILLVIPLACLIALYAYAASGAVGGAVSYRDSAALNAGIGAPLQVLLPQLDAERADTFAWQSARGRMPRTALVAQRALTDKAIALFRADAAAVAGRETATLKTVTADMEAKLTALRTVRADVDAGTITALAAFQFFNATVQLAFAFGVAQANPGESLAAYQLSRSEGDMGEAAEEISQEAALVGGALASGGTMSASLHQQFVQTVAQGRLFEQLNSSPFSWPQNLYRYVAVYTSPAFANFKAIEDKIVASRPGTRLPVSPAAWEASLKSVFAGIVAAQTAIRVQSTSGNAHAANVIILRLVLVGGAGLLAVILSCVLLLGFGNRISRELTQLRAAARTLAGERLPALVSRLRAGETVDVAAEAPPLDLGTRTREVTDTADAFSVVQRTAVEAAVDQARLRKGVSLVFRSLARRNQSLLQRQLRLLDEMERDTGDPDALERLFRLDHLTTRMRRQAEGLIILSGAPPGRTWRQPVPVVEVLRGAVGEIEDYARVDLVTDSPDFMQGTAVADITHMLAELIENAVLCSPPSTRVQVRGGRVAKGYVLEVEDRGLGIPPDTMAVLNERLAQPPEFDLADNDRLGLFVVSRLAARHGIKVSLRMSVYGGTTAIILLPPSLIVAEEEVPFLVGQAEIGRSQADADGGLSQERAGPQRALVPALPADGARDEGPSLARPAGLPRRQAGANLAPQLREDRPGSPKEPLAGRSPEQARKLMSAIQQGLRNSRANTSQGGTEQPDATGDWSGQ